jgi:hypothetical protein
MNENFRKGRKEKLERKKVYPAHVELGNPESSSAQSSARPKYQLGMRPKPLQPILKFRQQLKTSKLYPIPALPLVLMNFECFQAVINP